MFHERLEHIRMVAALRRGEPDETPKRRVSSSELFKKMKINTRAE